MTPLQNATATSYPFVEYICTPTSEIDSDGAIITKQNMTFPTSSVEKEFTSIVTSIDITNTTGTDIIIDILFCRQVAEPEGSGVATPDEQIYSLIIGEYLKGFEHKRILQTHLTLNSTDYLIAKSRDEDQKFSCFCCQILLKNS